MVKEPRIVCLRPRKKMLRSVFCDARDCLTALKNNKKGFVRLGGPLCSTYSIIIFLAFFRSITHTKQLENHSSFKKYFIGFLPLEYLRSTSDMPFSSKNNKTDKGLGYEHFTTRFYYEPVFRPSEVMKIIH